MDPFPLVDARTFLPDLGAADFIEAYAACGGYPLHLRRWSAEQDTDANLRELAFTPGGLLLRDATDILAEDLDWRGGYERVLSAMAGGARRRSRIAGRAQQRIDYTLDRLKRAGYIRVVRSIGEAGSPDPLYEIADDYLAHWFTVLRDDADLIEGGQGPAVRQRTVGRWQTHVARVFEAEARAHAQRLVGAGQLPADTVVGRWWRDETAEIDVLGLSQAAPVLVGGLGGRPARSSCETWPSCAARAPICPLVVPPCGTSSGRAAVQPPPCCPIRTCTCTRRPTCWIDRCDCDYPACLRAAVPSGRSPIVAMPVWIARSVRALGAAGFGVLAAQTGLPAGFALTAVVILAVLAATRERSSTTATDADRDESPVQACLLQAA
jgi:hypothetical protein